VETKPQNVVYLGSVSTTVQQGVKPPVEITAVVELTDQQKSELRKARFVGGDGATTLEAF
jgi:hypothetical protein